MRTSRLVYIYLNNRLIKIDGTKVANVRAQWPSSTRHLSPIMNRQNRSRKTMLKRTCPTASAFDVFDTGLAESAAAGASDWSTIYRDPECMRLRGKVPKSNSLNGLPNLKNRML